MTTAIEKLMFTVGINDMISQPLMGINNTLGNMKAHASGGFDAMRGGAVGLAGSLLSIKELMSPVYEMQKALGEVKSLSVADAALNRLENTALDFSMQYGESAADFVRSSYDIQSAIAGLTGNELSEFTNASNVLAKGTKADAETITSYMGTMYGIFKNNADAMGKAEWVSQLTGQTAEAVRMFKTNGAQMSGAFTSLGANATAAGIALNEQMAILGTLQATMSGSEAGTKYRSFLASAAKAQETLGLQFTDSQGRLLPMIDILETLRSKYGDSFNEMESLELSQAFGTQEAVSMIKLLMNDTAGLAKNINALGKINGMKNAEDMAKAMVDPWEQFTAVTEALRISFGNSLLPTINDVLSKMSDGLMTVYDWTKEFPNITRVVGLATLTLLGMSAATAAFSIIVGLSRTAFAAFGIAVLIGRGIFAAVAASMWLFSKAMLFFNTILKAVRIAMILFNVALYTNPISLVVIGVIALTGVLGYLIYRVGSALGWWEKLTDVMADIGWLKPIQKAFNWIVEKLEGFAGWLGMDLGLSDSLKSSLAIEHVAPPLDAMNMPLHNRLHNPSHDILNQTVGTDTADVVTTSIDPAVNLDLSAVLQQDGINTDALKGLTANVPVNFLPDTTGLESQISELTKSFNGPSMNITAGSLSTEDLTPFLNDFPIERPRLEHTETKIKANVTIEPQLLNKKNTGFQMGDIYYSSADELPPEAREMFELLAGG